MFPVVQDFLTYCSQFMVALALEKTKVNFSLVTPHVFCSGEFLVAD